MKTSGSSSFKPIPCKTTTIRKPTEFPVLRPAYRLVRVSANSVTSQERGSEYRFVPVLPAFHLESQVPVVEEPLRDPALKAKANPDQSTSRAPPLSAEPKPAHVIRSDRFQEFPEMEEIVGATPRHTEDVEKKPLKKYGRSVSAPIPIPKPSTADKFPPGWKMFSLSDFPVRFYPSADVAREELPDIVADMPRKDIENFTIVMNRIVRKEVGRPHEIARLRDAVMNQGRGYSVPRWYFQEEHARSDKRL